MGARKPFGVWMLLQDGQPWLFGGERTLAEAVRTAVMLRGAGRRSVWIAETRFGAWRRHGKECR
jgi:hypothetical protein